MSCSCSCSYTESYSHEEIVPALTVAVWLSYICMLFACTWVGLLSSQGWAYFLENTPIPLFEQILNSSPMGVFSRDYGTHLQDTLFIVSLIRGTNAVHGTTVDACFLEYSSPWSQLELQLVASRLVTTGTSAGGIMVDDAHFLELL